ncbi:Hypothetical predicted protein [Drosophila guanche]|uniref:TIL domain-containing protein n=1 Tax=Drosophila guanche TaxID=7266 RepID=A0A3B0J5I8_DROGU|nr:Hypothetical predicted protein [Drosophila guanche]
MFRLGLIVSLLSISSGSLCGRNEVQVICGNPCPKSCHPHSCVRSLCYGRCNCLGGYMRVSRYQGPCVLPSECEKYPMMETHQQKTPKSRSKFIQFRHLPTVTQGKPANKRRKPKPRSVKAKGLRRVTVDLFTPPSAAVVYDYFDGKSRFDYGEVETTKRVKPTTTSKPAALQTESSPFIQEHIQR